MSLVLVARASAAIYCKWVAVGPGTARFGPNWLQNGLKDEPSVLVRVERVHSPAHLSPSHGCSWGLTFL